jgi:hypothetical protein
VSYKKKLPYRDGDWFAVPLRDVAGFAVGVVAAHDGRGGVIAYFFNKRFDAMPSLAEIDGLDRGEVLRAMRFGDLGLINEKWPVLTRREDWVASRWPIPDFGRRGPDGSAWRVVYSADDLRGPTREEPITADECDQLPRDALSGAGAVERVLTQLLASELSSESNGDAL